MNIKFPEVRVTLTGRDSNAYVLMGAVASEMRKAGISAAEIQAFREEATSGDYNKLLQTCMKWVTVS